MKVKKLRELIEHAGYMAKGEKPNGLTQVESETLDQEVAQAFIDLGTAVLGDIEEAFGIIPEGPTGIVEDSEEVKSDV